MGGTSECIKQGGGEVSLLVGFVHFMSCGISVNNVQEGEIGSGNGF